jgi:hypothetical protein
MAVDLPEDCERHEDQEGRHGVGNPGDGVAVGGRRTRGKTVACPVRRGLALLILRDSDPTHAKDEELVVPANRDVLRKKPA